MPDSVLRPGTAVAPVAVLLAVLLAAGCGLREGDTGSSETSISFEERHWQVASALERGDVYSAAILLDAESDTTGAAFAFLRGRVDEALGFRDRARDRYREVTRLAPGFAGGWYHRALVEAADRNHDGAIELFGEALTRESNPAVWHGLGQAHFEAGRVDSALTALRRAAAIDSTYAPARVAASAVLRVSGDYEAAERELRAAARHDSSFSTRKELANVLLARDKEGEAARLLFRLASARPWDAQVQYDLARASRALGLEEEAGRAYARFEENTAAEAEAFRLRERIRLAPASVRDRLELVDVYRAAGRIDEAIATIYPVIYLVPNNPQLRNNAALLNLSRGDTAHARSMFESALRIDSTFAPARDGLRRLGES